MNDDFIFDVFLSHSSKDKTMVLALAQRLRQDGVRVWYDDWEILPGNSIPLKINQGLAQSRRVALCMSAHAFEADWVGMEIQTILYDDPLNKQGRFIPIRLDDTQTKPEFAPFASIDWRTQSDSAYAQLLRTFRPPPTPSNPPACALLSGPPDFNAFAQAWPHARDALQLAFVDDARRVIHSAHCSTDLLQCDNFTLRLTSKQPGQLLLLLQNTDHTFCQIYPHTVSPPFELGVDEYYLPGALLDLSNHAPAQRRLCFQTPGVERVLGFLLPTLPVWAQLHEPMSRLSEEEIRKILLALCNEQSASMALARVTIHAQPSPQNR